MSFGFAIGDFATVGQLCWKVYRKCKDAPGEFSELSREVRALHAVIKETEKILPQQSLTPDQQAEFNLCRQGCNDVLQSLDARLLKNKSLGTQSRRNIDRVRFAIEDVNGIRVRLSLNLTTLNVFMTTRIERTLSLLIDELRAGRREGPVVSRRTIDSLNRNDQDTWKTLRRDLKNNGISSDVIKKKRHFIIDRFKKAVATGRFEEDASSDDFSSRPDSESSQTLNAATDTRPTHIPQDRDILPATGVSHTPQGVQSKRRKKAGSENLTQAVFAGDMDLVFQCIEDGADIEATISDERTALGHAVAVDDVPMAQLLLDNGADVDTHFPYPSHGHVPRCGSALHCAVIKASYSMVKLLLDNGANVNAKDETGDTALKVSAGWGDSGIVELLLEKGLDIDVNVQSNLGDTALVEAAWRGYDDVVQMLLEKGAEVDTTDAGGQTALSWAIEFNHTKAVRRLQDAGARITRITPSGVVYIA